MSASEPVTSVAPGAGLQLVRPSLRDQTLRVLRQRLVTGALVPGRIYSVTALAAELGVSNSPVREAMLELQNQGLVEAVRNRGFCVVQLSRREREDILQVRMMLEVPAMAQLAGRQEYWRADAEFTRVAEEITQAAEANDLLAFLDADRRFHLGLLRLLGNEALVDVVALMRDRTRLFADHTSILRSAAEHSGILDALRHADPVAASQRMTEHLHHVLDDWSGDPPQ
ncbi:MAG: GntR family transcriptional regulator [Quadrisphaera sp.]